MAPGARSGRRVKVAPGARSGRRANGRSGRGATSGGGVPVAPIVVGVGTVLTGLLFMWLVAPTLWTDREAPAPPEPPPPAPTAAATTSTTTSTTTTTTTTTTEPPFEGWVDPATSGQRWGDAVEGLLTFRGNPTRTYYGKGPVPDSPDVLWYFPPGPAMCSLSEVKEETTNWCGTGWTGQPAVFERDGATWVVVGAYDKAVHFLDADTGGRIVGDFGTGDLIKGSVTIDPDGYPLVYFGSRDNKYRVVAFDRDEPEELWALDAYSVSSTRWNDDWDGAGLVLDDYLFVGGENSRFHVVKLNRGYDGETGLATADPELVFDAPGWDDELIEAVGSNVSIESSVAISGDTAYFANSGGLIQGWDIAGLASGEAPERGVQILGRRRHRRHPGDRRRGHDLRRGGVRAGQRPVGRGGPDHQARPQSGRPAGVERSRAPPPQLGGVGHPRPSPGSAHRAHRHRQGAGARRRHRRGALDQGAARPDLVEPGDRRRRVDPGRLPGLAAGLRRERHRGGAARAVAGGPASLHRIDPGGVGRLGGSRHSGRLDSTPSADVGRAAGRRGAPGG